MSSKILRTKIIPPPANGRTLARPRVSLALRQAFDYRLTILQAGAGYGKSTALGELSRQVAPLIWYQVYEEDNDPLIFLLHLCHATLQAMPDIPNLPVAFLESFDGSQGPLVWRPVVDDLINCLSTYLEKPVLFILDDAQLVTGNGEVIHILDRLIGRAPAQLHILLSGRPPISLPTLSRYRAQGDLLSLDQTTLMFSSDETAALFSRHYGVELTTEEVEALLTYSEGWAIALQLIWQSIRSQSFSALEFPQHWRPQAGSLDALFDMLTSEVFEQIGRAHV